MMSLVAYGSSDEDGSDDEGDHIVLASKLKPETSTGKIGIAVDRKLSPPEGFATSSDLSDCTNKDLFSKLPAPSSTSSVFAVKDSIVPGKKSSLQRGPVRISVPSLPELDDSDEPPTKKRLQQSSKGTKLTSMLPPPKGSDKRDGKTALVPNSVARKPITAHPSKQAPALIVSSKPQTHDDSGDESGTEDNASDFFSLTTDHSVPIAHNANSFNAVISSNEDLLLTEERNAEHTDHHPLMEPTDILDSSENYVGSQADSGQDYIPFESSDLQLDEEAMQKLCGRKGRRNQENVQIIDVNGDSIMPDSREWLTKQLSEEKPRASSHRKKDGPSSQQRRKHQITYLAFQAKENELELQNQWANNRQSRRQTQSKYGF